MDNYYTDANSNKTPMLEKAAKSWSQANFYADKKSSIDGIRKKRSQSATSPLGNMDLDTFRKLEGFFEAGKNGDENKVCLRKSTQPKFDITGDLNPHQINLIKRIWTKTFSCLNDDECEMAILLLVRTFELDPKQKHNFNLDKVDIEDLRIHPIFVDYVKSFQPLLLNVFKYTNRATIMSKYLQQMGGKLMRYTKVSYKSSYWKVFEQALIDVVSGGNAGDETIEALTILANFCSEQMRIGFRIEYKLQEAALRMVALQERKKVKKNK